MIVVFEMEPKVSCSVRPRQMFEFIGRKTAGNALEWTELETK